MNLMVMSVQNIVVHEVIDLFFWGDELGEPRNMRADIGAESGGVYPVTVQWDAPASWGDDRDPAQHVQARALVSRLVCPTHKRRRHAAHGDLLRANVVQPV